MLDRLKMAEQAMVNGMAQLDTIANNLANVSTTGFKRDEMFMQELAKQVKGLQFPVTGSIVDFSQGGVSNTGQPLDVAISGNALLAIESPQGETYTRDGRFTLNNEGVLTNVDGYPVLGEGGQIELNVQERRPSDIIINDVGEILLDGAIVDRLKIIGIDDPQNFEKLGGNLFRYTAGGAPPPPDNVSVRQGFLEQSNVNPVRELIAMIEVQRAFETNQKLIQQQDTLLGKAVTDIGRVR